MNSLLWPALLLLIPATSALGQASTTVAATANTTTTAPVASAPSTQAIEDARTLLLVMRVDEVVGRMADTMGPQASALLLAEVRQLPDGEAMLAAWDRDYPGGRVGFAQRYQDILIEKFRDGRLLFVDHMSIEMAGLHDAADLHFARVTLLDSSGAMKTGEALAAARATLASNGVAQRLGATQAQVTAEMSRFGQELGQSFGVQAFQQVVAEEQARRARSPATP